METISPDTKYTSATLSNASSTTTINVNEPTTTTTNTNTPVHHNSISIKSFDDHKSWRYVNGDLPKDDIVSKEC